jgi:hypothetical protein
MRIQELEEKISDLEVAIAEIEAYGDAYVNGERKTAENLPALEALLATYQQQRTNMIGQPVTLERSQRMIYLCHEAMEAILAGKEYEMEGMKLTRASLNDVRSLLNYWETEKARIEAGVRHGVKVYRGVNFDD